MSSEESLNSDNDYKNNNKNKMKQRKPDMQVYVPRAKRIEDQVKQRMSSEFPVPVGPSKPSGDQKVCSSSSPSPDRNAGKIYWQREFQPSWEVKNERKMKERANSDDSGDKALSKHPIKIAVQRKGPPPPQPQTNKLPSQVIEEMMKRHNIAVAGPPADPKPGSASEIATMDISMEKMDEPLIQFSEATIEQAKSEGDSSILSCLPATYQDFIMEEIALSAAAASQRFAAVLPVSVEGRQSHSLTSTSPTNSETPEILPLPSCSGGRGSPCFDADDLEVKMINESFEEAQKQMQVLGSEAVKKAWTSYYSQPNPVYNPPMPPPEAIGASFQKHEKESADEVLPNVQESSKTSSAGTSKSRTSPESGAEPVISMASTKPVKIAASAKPDVGDSVKLTWAGWGAGAASGDPKTEAPIIISKTQLKPQRKEPEISTSLFSPTAAASSAMASDVHGKAEHSMLSVPLVPSYSSTSSASAASPPVGQEPAAESGKSPPIDSTKDMDILSAAMIEKVLSEDGDDFETVHGGSKFLPEPAPSETVQKQVASAKSSSSLCGKKNLADIWNRDENVNTLTGASGPGAAADSWEDLLDEPGDKIIAQLMEQVKSAPVKQKPERKEIDYFKLEPKEIELDEEFNHVLEAHGFPASMKGDDLYLALRQLHCREFKIEWVDDTHALVVFANVLAAQEACDSSHPVIKLRPLSKASSVAKSKAKRLKEALLPYMKRPETSASLARRLVEGHLGKRSEIGAEHRKRERDRLQEARDQKKVAAQQKADIWEGRL